MAGRRRGLVAVGGRRWRRGVEMFQDACFIFQEDVPLCLFHLSLIKPSLRRGQVKRCPGPWMEIGLTSCIVYIFVYVFVYVYVYVYTVVCGKMSVRPNMHSLKYNDIVPADVVVKANTPI